ncbi:hypothetical protein [Streptomyces chiangmaiensis]|uniref:Uncharacterized protein n=1 Tax=Streptomyces chiangmaiensis TaxID=766497 RepID=A0ABU7FNG2_9ACTN|nr:hypothetical protein [Streptomyces chiangmaiensis]MED7825353.1 hypothetical protein [Streptomyces chiangmaiensis]
MRRQGAYPEQRGGPDGRVKLPAKGVYHDNKLTAPYWQSTAADALSW